MSAAPPRPLVRFGSFEVNLEVGELRRYGHRIKLQGKPFQVLMALLERPGRLVSREELRLRLWSDDTFVDFDHNLNNAVDKLRKALNDSAGEPRFIETLPKRGYRFIAPIERHSAPLEPNEAAFAESSSHPSVKSLPLQPNLDSTAVRVNARLNRRIMIGSAAVAFLLLASFAAPRFLGPVKLLASSRYTRNSEIKSLVIEKNGALDPSDEGFTLHVHGRYETEAMRNASNHGFDRLKIISDDQAYYFRTLTAAEKRFAVTRDWKLTCICALERGQLSTNIDFGPGFRRFDIELLQEGDQYYVALTKTISPEMEWAQQIEFPGVGDIDHPHTYELRYDHLTETAGLWIDGRLIASGYRGHTQFLEDRGLMFGSYSYTTTTTGIGVFRAVRFEAY